MHKALSKYTEGQWFSGSKTSMQTEPATSPTQQRVSLEEHWQTNCCYLDMVFGSDLLADKQSRPFTSEKINRTF